MPIPDDFTRESECYRTYLLRDDKTNLLVCSYFYHAEPQTAELWLQALSVRYNSRQS